MSLLLKYLVLYPIRWFFGLLLLVTNPIFEWLYESERHKKLPAPTNDIVKLSALTLSSKIRNREIRCVDAVQAYIDRIRQVNPLVNALVVENFDEALKIARNIDDVLDSKQIPDDWSIEKAPLLGVPFTAKEAFGITGLPNTSGLLCRKGINASKDADVIAHLKRCGCIPIGLTNCSELCMWYESSNLVYGRTNNAYHFGRMVGGSSGGEGCILSTAASVIGVGSDIGGSIRMPAFFNGVFGHKPTTGIISSIGQHPCAKNEAYTFLSTGPMCRYAEDLIPMFKCMASDDDLAKLNLDATVDVNKLKYYYMMDDGGSPLCSTVHDCIVRGLNQVIGHLEGSLNARVEQKTIKKLQHSFRIWATMMQTSGNDTFCSLMGDNKTEVRPLVELLLWLIQRPRHTLPAIGLGIFEKPTQPEAAVKIFRKMLLDMKDEFRSLLGDNGVFLYPTHPLPAPYHNQPLLLISNFAYTGIFNMLGLPVTQVPLGLSKEGVPVGIQVVANYHCDHLCMAVAQELERAFGGWVPPYEKN